MFAAEERISLKNKVISTFYFDDNGRFAGLRTYDVRTKAFEEHHAALPYDMLHLLAGKDDQILMNSYDNTRLVGFRTKKTCDDAHDLMGIQPIYYSTDKEICKDHLNVLSSGMLEEIPFYGESCNETITK